MAEQTRLLPAKVASGVPKRKTSSSNTGALFDTAGIDVGFFLLILITWE